MDLGLEDLLMVVNFFSKVTVDEDGRFQFISANSRAGDYVELFAPMDVLMVLTALRILRTLPLSTPRGRSS
ncbi:Urea carboxylase-related aminomethyltransferase [Klebsiella michiganensis]|nr:Urea carboxylase-related aminomethyltransferase [Klebsiella michiganensis]